MVYLIILGALVVTGLVLTGIGLIRKSPAAVAGTGVTFLGIGALWVGLGILVCWGIGIPVSGERTIVETAELQALSTSSDVTGRFYLGSGSLNGSVSFVYVVDQGDYSTVETVPASQARIFEVEKGSPYVETTQMCDHSGVWLPWSTCDVTRNRVYEFHIPADSIVENYVIDVSS